MLEPQSPPGQQAVTQRQPLPSFKASGMNRDDKSEEARKTDSARLVQLAILERQYGEICRLRKEIEELRRANNSDRNREHSD